MDGVRDRHAVRLSEERGVGQANDVDGWIAEGLLTGSEMRDWTVNDQPFADPNHAAEQPSPLAISCRDFQ